MQIIFFAAAVNRRVHVQERGNLVLIRVFNGDFLSRLFLKNGTFNIQGYLEKIIGYDVPLYQ